MQSNVFIFGMPRSGTTLLQFLLSMYYKIPNAAEPLVFNKFDSVDQILDWLSRNTPSTIKILSGQLYFDHIDQFLDNKSKLFVCVRRNLANNCISLHVAKRLGHNHFTIKPDISHLGKVSVPLEHVHYWLTDIYRPYYHIVERWKSEGRTMTEICYEDLINNSLIDVGGSEICISQFPPTRFVNSEINYADLCSNYNEVQDMIAAFKP